METSTEMVEAKTETEVQDTPELGTDGTPFDAARAKELIAQLREDAKGKKAIEKKLAELQAADEQRKEAQLSELEKANKRAAELEAKLKTTELREMRGRIGAEYKLPAEIAERLQGDTDEAMKADAKKLADALPKQPTLTPTNPPSGQATPTDAQWNAFLYGGGKLP